MPQQSLKAVAHLAPPPPPLLLTKRVTSFLQANLSAHVHTAALATPSGRLLAHASHSAPARALRRQCAVAASLWSIHGPDSSFGDLADAALPKSCSTTPLAAPMLAKAVTVQLAGGVVFIVRALRCGLLFIAVGGSGSSGAAGAVPDPFQQQQQQQSSPLPPHNPLSPGARASEQHTHTEGNAAAVSSPPLGSPSDGGSVLSGGATAPSIASQATSAGGSSAGGSVSTATVLATRRQAEELARWLDDKLGSLSVPMQGTDLGWDAR